MRQISIRSQAKQELIDITSQVERVVREAGLEEGLCSVFVPHTTAGVLINENADPSVREDILMMLAKLIPQSTHYKHSEGNSPAHIKSSLVGSSVQVPVSEGRLKLGTWQGIIFCEFDGPRNRNAWISLLSA
ncbi:MAG: secondary thiamine-phosphate synthase enzyme YjbQ [Candidatus Bipolaricaulia bacterium]